MNTKSFVDSLNIFLKYYDDNYDYHIRADFESVSIDATDKPLNKNDLADVIKAGWFQDFGDDDPDEFKIEDYDPEVEWMCYL